MSDFPFQKFIKLVAFDQEIRSLEHQLSLLKNECDAYEAEIVRRNAELDVAKRHKDAMQREVDKQELEMKVLQEKQDEKERLLAKTTHPKECQALYHEIALIKQEQHDFEEQLLEAWHKLENATREYRALQQEIQKKIDDVTELIQKNKEQQQAAQHVLDERQKNRTSYEEGIPLEWLEKYALMRRAVANPVVPVINNSCSACFYQVVAQDLARLRNNALLQCRDCYRFLYMEHAQ